MARFLAWKDAQGGLELPVTLHTLLKPDQQGRISWLATQALPPVLEVGTSWGMVLAYIDVRSPHEANTGVDIASWNVDLARLLCPHLRFELADARSLPFADREFKTVVLAEILEHLMFPDDVRKAVEEAKRVASTRILVTLPNADADMDEAMTPKHAWAPDSHSVRKVLDMFEAVWEIRIDNLAPFFRIQADRRSH